VASGPLPVLVVHPDVVPGPRDYGVIRPTGIGLSADVNNQIRDLVWSSWTTTDALGAGSRVRDDCVPDCAAGKITMIPDVVKLSAVQNGRFTQMSETYGGKTDIYPRIDDAISSLGGTQAPLPPEATSTTPAQPAPPTTKRAPSGSGGYNNPATLAAALAKQVQAQNSLQALPPTMCVPITGRANAYRCTVTLPSGPDVAAIVVSPDGSGWQMTSSG
jgi:hypothetical protein